MPQRLIGLMSLLACLLALHVGSPDRAAPAAEFGTAPASAIGFGHSSHRHHVALTSSVPAAATPATEPGTATPAARPGTTTPAIRRATVTPATATPTTAALATTRVTRVIRQTPTSFGRHTGPLPDPSVVARFDRAPCGLGVRGGRNVQPTDRRESVEHQLPALPAVIAQREHAADGRPLTVVAANPLRPDVLRC